MIGTTVLLVSAILKLTPGKWVEGMQMNKFVDENATTTNLMDRFKKVKTEEPVEPA